MSEGNFYFDLIEELCTKGKDRNADFRRTIAECLGLKPRENEAGPKLKIDDFQAYLAKRFSGGDWKFWMDASEFAHVDLEEKLEGALHGLMADPTVAWQCEHEEEGNLHNVKVPITAWADPVGCAAAKEIVDADIMVNFVIIVEAIYGSSYLGIEVDARGPMRTAGIWNSYLRTKKGG